MKQIKAITAIIILVLACLISFHVGKTLGHTDHSKDYQVAQIMTTCCFNMMDNLGNDAEEIYYEYIDNLYCYPGITITKEDIDNYNSWN